METSRTKNPAVRVSLLSRFALVNFKPSARQAKREGVYVSKHPCPYARQHAVSKDCAVILELDSLFAEQRDRLKRTTGVPYFTDASAERAAQKLLDWGKARGFTC